jgi:hypothetical protein
MRHRRGIANPLLLCLLVGWPVVYDLNRYESKRVLAGQLVTGAEREEVRAVMGPPNVVFERGSGLLDPLFAPLVGPTPERWAYGRCLDFEGAFLAESPTFFPFRFRLFGPDPDDVMVEFAVTGRVTRAVIPAREPSDATWWWLRRGSGGE